MTKAKYLFVYFMAFSLSLISSTFIGIPSNNVDLKPSSLIINVPVPTRQPGTEVSSSLHDYAELQTE